MEEINKQIKHELKNRQIEFDDEGRSIIDITVYDDEYFLSPYTSNNNELISDEVATFLDHSVKVVSPKEPLHINIISNSINQNEEIVYKRAIKNYYLNQIVDINRKLRFNSIASAMFTLIGLLTFFILLLLDSTITSEIIYEIFSIFGWVFLWEAVDQFFIERNKLNRQKNRDLNIYGAKITFNKLNKKID